MQFERAGTGLAAAIVITVAIIRGTLYADGRYIPAAVHSDGTGNPGRDRQAARKKAFEAAPWPVLANSGASWPQPGPAPRVAPAGFLATSDDG